MSFSYSFQHIAERPEYLAQVYALGKFRIVRQSIPNAHGFSYRVFLRDKQIGSQVSRPRLDDCERMTRPVAPLEHYDPRTKYSRYSRRGARAKNEGAARDAQKQRRAKGSAPSIRCIGNSGL